MRIVNQALIISSTDQNATFESQRQAAITLNGVLSDLGLPFKKAKGVYKGLEEDAFVVVVKNQEEIDSLTAIAFNSFNQESVLHQDANQQATLLFSNGTRKPLGKLVQVQSTDGLEAYTVVDGNIYAAI